jgi:hypothetical protein
VVATVSPTPGIYNVTATATGSNGSISCRLQTQSSSGHGSVFNFTVSGHATESNNTLETGAIKVDSGSLIEESCRGASGTHVIHRDLTAVQVASAQPSASGPLGHKSATATDRPMNSFVGKAVRRKR